MPKCDFPTCANENCIPTPVVKPIVSTRELIVAECERVKELLLHKNTLYGDSATNPIRIMSRLSAEEGLKVRIDDKLSRLARGDDGGEDTTIDLIGYLVLLRVVRGSK